MAKDKERSINPAQQQRKLDKAKALKKGKAEVQARRNEKLARRNPERLQREIDDLKALEARGDIKPREKSILEELERDLRAIRKARDALGDKAPQFRSQNFQKEGGDGKVLGKRRYDGERKPYQKPEESSGSETDESVRRIPMPRDTPPPMPREYRRNTHNANNEPLGLRRNLSDQPGHALPPTPAAAEVKTTYESAPQIRDLKQEAVKRFVPNVVRQKQQAAKGVGGLVEPEEMDRLEAEGYVARTESDAANPAKMEDGPASQGPDLVLMAEEEARRLAEEEERFQRELEMEETAAAEPGEAEDAEGGGASATAPRRQVQIEEVEDEDM